MTGKLVIFPSPEDATVTLIHDSGRVFTSQPKTVAGRPAQVVQIDQDVPNGHGAALVLQRAGYSPQDPHGVLWMDMLNPETQSVGLLVDTFTLQPLPAPTPVPGPTPVFGPLHVTDSHLFTANGARWKAKGATDFRMLKRVYDGEDVRPLLDQRKAAGANILRIASMKANNTGWHLDPREDSTRFWASVDTLWRWMKERELWAYQSVLLDTKMLGIDHSTQQLLWTAFGDAARSSEFAGQILLELMNENGHPTQQVDPWAFTRQTGVLCSRGSGLTDADVVRPTWDIAGYSSRRDSPPDTRGFTNYDPYEFQALYPKECPMWAQEGMKPQHYGHDPVVAGLMGAHAGMCDGGFFHTEINSDPWSPAIEACARAFYQEIR